MDVKCEPQIALGWAVRAKNALQNHGGFSPNELVLCHNINTSCNLTDKLPALESTTSSDIIWRNMEAMHKAKQNYVQAESSEKIHRALCHKVGRDLELSLGKIGNLFLSDMEGHITVYIRIS